MPFSAKTRSCRLAAIDSADRAMRCLNESDWPLVAMLYGDYQSIAIKNTRSELEEQDARMRHVLVESGKRFGMIFVGYSGRDASIMEALNTVLDARSPFPNGVYWLTSSASRLLPAVIEFLERAGAAGVDVAVVECATFDELAADIIKVTDLSRPLLDRVMEGRPTPRLVPVQIPHANARAFGNSAPVDAGRSQTHQAEPIDDVGRGALCHGSNTPFVEIAFCTDDQLRTIFVRCSKASLTSRLS